MLSVEHVIKRYGAFTALEVSTGCWDPTAPERRL